MYTGSEAFFADSVIAAHAYQQNTFGGDAIDRGPHGRRIVRTLLEVKTRQPGQVVLLAPEPSEGG